VSESNGQTPSQTSGQTPAEIEADIARQREALADTVDELQARLDVKARARAKVAELRDRATDDSGRPTPAVIGAAVGVLLLVGALVYRRRTH
jgi:MYXO-CTERM domain-containing protein